MKEKTEITFLAVDEMGGMYDASVKELFANREIIAPVLKAVVSEYQDCTYEEIINFIDQGSIVSDPVDDVSVRAEVSQTEMSSISDKLIRYDTRFRAVNPKLTTEVICFYLHIDIEVQNDYRPANPSYPVIKRAIYYGAREISAQLGVLTEETNYAALQKAYSIWICNKHIPKKLQNTVTRYTLKKEDCIGTCDEPEVNHDLLEIIMIRRGNDAGKESIFEYLTSIFTVDFEKMKPYLGEHESTQKIERKVKGMTGLGADIFQKGYRAGESNGEARGRSEGISIGEARGRTEERVFILNQISESGLLTPELMKVLEEQS